MTSKSLFFKLLRENVKRRAWAIALAVLGFFFSLPINLAPVPVSYTHLTLPTT